MRGRGGPAGAAPRRHDDVHVHGARRQQPGRHPDPPALARWACRLAGQAPSAPRGVPGGRSPGLTPRGGAGLRQGRSTLRAIAKDPPARLWHHVPVPDPQASSAPVDAGPATRIRLVRPVSPQIRPYFVLGLISLLFSLYLTWHLLGDLPHRMVAGNPADIRLFTWYLEQDSQSVLHLHDPLFFTTMN